MEAVMARCGVPIPARTVTALAAAAAVAACSEQSTGFPSTEGLRAVNGTELYVKRVGSGDPIVVVHGGPVLEHGYLLPHLLPLARSHELVFYDQRLSGRSAGTVDSSTVRLSSFVEDIEALRVSLGLGRIVLMGHSWGGLLAMEYAVRYGEHLRALVLLDPMPPSAALWQREESIFAARVTPRDSADLAALRATEAFARREPAAVERALRISFLPQFHDRTRIDALRLYVPADYAKRSRQFGFMMADLLSFDLLDSLSAVTVPTLIVYGADEPAADLSGPALVEHLPRGRLVTVEGAGHFPFIERPEAFLSTVETFLRDPEDDG
jgi:proline iminopeptidase